ncbi:MAG: hypothetical protein IJR55_06410 [Clostridia bacterium]|nr:hypothetical protein [Clostridia bacterium]
MRKILGLIMALLIVASVPLLSACSQSARYEKAVFEHLNKKYPEKTFRLLAYKKNNNSNGRYEIDAVCDNDSTKFSVYVYPNMFITDGYSVSRANSMALAELHSAVAYTASLQYISNIRWLRPYNEENTDYSFRTVDSYDDFSLENLKTIDTIYLDSPTDVESAEMGIITSIYALNAYDVNLENVGFEFSIKGYKNCRFTTDTASVLAAEKGEIAKCIEEGINTSGIIENALAAVNTFKVDFRKQAETEQEQ